MASSFRSNSISNAAPNVPISFHGVEITDLFNIRFEIAVEQLSEFDANNDLPTREINIKKDE